MSHYMDQAKVYVRDQADRLLDDLASRIAINFDNFGVEEGYPSLHSEVTASVAPETAPADPWGERAAQVGYELAISGLYKATAAVMQPKRFGRSMLMSTLSGVQDLHDRRLHHVA